MARIGHDRISCVVVVAEVIVAGSGVVAVVGRCDCLAPTKEHHYKTMTIAIVLTVIVLLATFVEGVLFMFPMAIVVMMAVVVLQVINNVQVRGSGVCRL